MQIFNQQKDLTAVSQEIDGLLKYVARLLAEKDVLVEDLKLFEFEGYADFKNVLLEKEKSRLASLRMEIHSSEISQHDSLQGQYNQCVVLSKKKEAIELGIKIHERKILDVHQKIEKLKKQLQTQIERK